MSATSTRSTLPKVQVGLELGDTGTAAAAWMTFRMGAERAMDSARCCVASA